MSDDYSFSQEVVFLDFLIRWNSNQQILIDILNEQFLYYRLADSARIRDTFDFYIEIVEDSNTNASWNTALRHRYDIAENLLYLSYLNGAIRVTVNYKRKEVRAKIMELALAYRAALGNWVLTIPLSELLKMHDIYLMHAACLVKDGRGILFAGRSGAGKTTLSIGLLSLGWHMVSDDEIFLCYDQDLMAYGGPEKAKVSWPTWRRFSYYLGKQTRFNGKQIIRLNDYFPGQILDRHGVSVVCFVEQSERVAVSPMSEMEAYQHLLSVAFLTSEPDLTRQNNDFIYRLSRELSAWRLHTSLDFKTLDAKLSQIIP